VLESVREIYRFEAVAKKQGLDPQACLRFRQTHSQLVMEALEEWIDEQIESCRIEPNSNLRDAIEFMRRHWGLLTLFLRELGTPLDNNLCEQSLKMAILHWKNSLGFKTPWRPGRRPIHEPDPGLPAQSGQPLGLPHGPGQPPRPGAPQPGLMASLELPGSP